MDTFKRVLRPVLLLVNVFVLLCGAAVIFLGVWALEQEQKYYTITREGDTQGTRIPTSLIVAGIIVSSLALLGLIGAAIANTYPGRIVLGMIVFVLSFMIMMELGCASAAVHYRHTLPRRYTDSMLESQYRAYIAANRTYCDQNWTSNDRWDHFQQRYRCCGSTGYRSYNMSDVCPSKLIHSNATNATNATGFYPIELLYNENWSARPLSVPPSCCNRTELPDNETFCDSVTGNVTSDNVKYIYQRGCSEAVLGTLRRHQLVIAVITFIVTAAQVACVVIVSVIVYWLVWKDGAKERKYKKLKRLTTMGTAVSTSVQR